MFTIKFPTIGGYWSERTHILQQCTSYLLLGKPHSCRHLASWTGPTDYNNNIWLGIVGIPTSKLVSKVPLHSRDRKWVKNILRRALHFQSQRFGVKPHKLTWEIVRGLLWQRPISTEHTTTPFRDRRKYTCSTGSAPHLQYWREGERVRQRERGTHKGLFAV